MILQKHIGYPSFVGTLNMVQIDEISQSLGRLEANAEYQARELSNMRSDVAVIKDATTSLSKEGVLQEQQIKALWAKIDVIEPKVNDHEKIKNKGLGILSILGVIMGGIGYVISNFIIPSLTRFF